MIRITAVVAVFALASCAPEQQATAARVAADAAAKGTLFCQAGSELLMIAGVNVQGASARAVAGACAAAKIAGAVAPLLAPPVPVAAPAGAVAVVATVPDAAAAAVKASAVAR